MFHEDGRTDMTKPIIALRTRLKTRMSIHGFAVTRPGKAFPTFVELIFPLPCSQTFVFDR
jgi:hypothetical protein